MNRNHKVDVSRTKQQKLDSPGENKAPESLEVFLPPNNPEFCLRLESYNLVVNLIKSEDQVFSREKAFRKKSQTNKGLQSTAELRVVSILAKSLFLHPSKLFVLTYGGNVDSRPLLMQLVIRIPHLLIIHQMVWSLDSVTAWCGVNQLYVSFSN